MTRRVYLSIIGNFDIEYLKDGDKNFPLDREEASAILKLLQSTEQTSTIKWLKERMITFIDRCWA